jgi:hypothetical protein
MRRIILVLAACATASLGLTASAQAAAHAKAYHLNVYTEGSEGPEFFYEATVDLYGKVHSGTWAMSAASEETCEGGAEPSGSYVKESHTFTFTVTSECGEGLILTAEHVKHKKGTYYGPITFGVGGVIGGYAELIKE